MFDNIGAKIKNVTVIICLIGILAFVIAGIFLISEDSYRNPTAGLGWTLLLAGPLSVWLGSFCMYAFGELVEKTCENNAALLRIEESLSVISGNLPAAGVTSAAASSTASSAASVLAPAAASSAKRENAKKTPVSAPVVAAEAPNPEAAPAVVDRNADEEVLAAVSGMDSAKAILDYAAATFDAEDENVRALIKHLERSVNTEHTYGNNKYSAEHVVISFIKNGRRVFAVDRYDNEMECPACGKMQRNDRKVCASCSALFRD